MSYPRTDHFGRRIQGIGEMGRSSDSSYRSTSLSYYPSVQSWRGADIEKRQIKAERFIESFNKGGEGTPTGEVNTTCTLVAVVIFCIFSSLFAGGITLQPLVIVLGYAVYKYLNNNS